MSEKRVQRRLAAVIAADVVGYSMMMERDEAGTLARLKAIRSEFLHPKIAEYGGRIVKTTGDGTLIEFGSAVDAVSHAIDVQRGMARQNASEPEDRRIVFRIGINLGDIIIDGDDIFGDGVNVAARLEALAEPGGICLSGAVYEHVRDKLDAEFEDLREQTVKNISRPVSVYRLRGMTEPKSPSARGKAPSLPDKPSIAVLPFDNMSGDAEQDYFADGITEDIITELSRFHDLSVIARNSTFTFKGRPLKSQDVGRELGAQYVVEGSVRKAGARVRVTAQLIDASTGNHLWAERFDRELVDIFEVQDELTRSIVAVLPGRLEAAQIDRVRRKPPEDMAAYDFLLAGKIHHHRVTRDDNREAQRLLNKAIELDPEFAQAYAWKACTLGQASFLGFTNDPDAALAEAFANIQRAVTLDENDIECNRLLCEIGMSQEQWDRAQLHHDKAFGQNPNDPRLLAQKGELLSKIGRPIEGADFIRTAMRLDPLRMQRYAHLLGRALFTARRYEEAIDAYKQIASPRADHLAEMAGCYAQLEMAGDAGRQIAEVLRLNPGFSIAAHMHRATYRDAADREHYRGSLLKAGLPE